jgi:hypothetical protein
MTNRIERGDLVKYDGTSYLVLSSVDGYPHGQCTITGIDGSGVVKRVPPHCLIVVEKAQYNKKANVQPGDKVSYMGHNGFVILLNGDEALVTLVSNQRTFYAKLADLVLVARASYQHEDSQRYEY